MYWEQDEGFVYIQVGQLTLWVKDRRKWVLSWLGVGRGCLWGSGLWEWRGVASQPSQREGIVTG